MASSSYERLKNQTLDEKKVYLPLTVFNLYEFGSDQAFFEWFNDNQMIFIC